MKLAAAALALVAGGALWARRQVHGIDAGGPLLSVHPQAFWIDSIGPTFYAVMSRRP